MAHLRPTLAENTVAIGIISLTRYKVLSWTRSRIEENRRYPLSKVDGLTERLCSKWEIATTWMDTARFKVATGIEASVVWFGNTLHNTSNANWTRKKATERSWYHVSELPVEYDSYLRVSTIWWSCRLFSHLDDKGKPVVVMSTGTGGPRVRQRGRIAQKGVWNQSGRRWQRLERGQSQGCTLRQKGPMAQGNVALASPSRFTFDARSQSPRRSVYTYEWGC